MDSRVIDIKAVRIVETVPDSGVIQSEEDALDLVAACGEFRSSRLLVHHENLAGDFYNLKSGLAGDVLLKFSNYHLRVAALIPAERIGEGRFAEFAMETNRGRQFRIFQNRQDALEWLSNSD